jgi:hypothetical protein
MKMTFAIIGLCVVFCGQAGAQTNHIVTNEIVTISGGVYKQVEIKKVDPSGIVISYSIPSGGLGIARLKFTDLPEQTQKRFGYDPLKAEVFELLEEKSVLEMRQKLVADEIIRQQFAAAREQSDFQARHLIDLEQESAKFQQQQIEIQRKLAEAAMKQAEAAQAAAQQPPAQINMIQQQKTTVRLQH